MLIFGRDDAAAMRQQFGEARPFPHVFLDGLLDAASAAAIAAAFPSYETARAIGREFRTVNERRKVQISDPRAFPEAVRDLARWLTADEWLGTLSELTGIDDLIADPDWLGGGMHMMASGGQLDVHVDFNRLQGRLYRRLNLIIFFNPRWEPGWGGSLEIWDPLVRERRAEVAPLLNRCALFETIPTGFHGVSTVRCPAHIQRQSFAVYYYTVEPPPQGHTRVDKTLFRARPGERLKRHLLMPAEQLMRRLRAARARSR